MAVIKKKSAKQRTRKLFLLGGVFLFLGYLFFANKILSYKKELKSNNFLIEGWVSPHTLERFANQMKNKNDYCIFIVGREFEANKEELSFEYLPHHSTIPLYGNAMVYLPLKYLDSENIILGINSRGQHVFDYPAFYTLSSKERIITSGFLPMVDSTVFFSEILSERKDTLIISFINDIRGSNGDRNLYIEFPSIEIDNHHTHNIQYAFVNGINKDSGYSSQPAKVKNYLIHLGVPPEKIREISYTNSKKNLTWASAKATADYIISKTQNLEDLIIITEGHHSLRSYIAYKRWINSEQVDLGVTYYEDDIIESKYTTTNLQKKIRYIFDESFSILITLVKPKSLE
ncbi:MAG: hypothetical protein ACOC2F_01890 [Bacteroidota bacterium]